jgi:hypothetical protein
VGACKGGEAQVIGNWILVTAKNGNWSGGTLEKSENLNAMKRKVSE